MTPRPLFRTAAVLLPALSLACADDGRLGNAVEVQAPLVEAVQARVGALPVEVELPGVVRARNQVAIRPEVSGRVVEVLVRSGAAVERGQPLVRLAEAEAGERLRQAEADVRLTEASAAAARARVEELAARAARSRALAEQRLVSAQELETLEAQLEALEASADESAARVEQARASAEERRSALGKTVVRAPVTGRLGERRAEVGMQVDSSTLLFLIGDLDELIVDVDLTEDMLATVIAGMPAEIEARTSAAPAAIATVSRISPFLAEESFTARGEIDVDNRDGQLRPGMFVNVRILVGQSRQATLVPVSAIWEDPGSGRRGVFVIQEAEGLETPAQTVYDSPDEPRAVEFRPVEMLAQGSGTAGVSGIDDGAWVVTVGQQMLGEATRASPRAGSTSETAAMARIRPVTWERVLELQGLQDEDLLEAFLDKQQKVAAALGAEIPESEAVVKRVLDEAAKATSGAGGA